MRCCAYFFLPYTKKCFFFLFFQEDSIFLKYISYLTGEFCKCYCLLNAWIPVPSMESLVAPEVVQGWWWPSKWWSSPDQKLGIPFLTDLFSLSSLSNIYKVPILWYLIPLQNIFFFRYEEKLYVLEWILTLIQNN